MTKGKYTVIPVVSNAPHVALGYGSGAKLFCLKCYKKYPLPPKLVKHLAAHNDEEAFAAKSQLAAITRTKQQLKKMTRRRRRGAT